MNEKKRTRDIESSEIIKLWIKKACGTETTERVYVPRLIKFLEYYNATPEEIIERWKEVRYNWTERQKFIDEWSEKIENYYAMSDHAPLTKLSEIAPIKSFFKHSKIPIEVQTKKHAHTIYHNRDITKSELRRMLDHSGLREKVFFLMMAESGLRPRTLVQLKYRDIREDFEANRIPMKRNLRMKCSSCGHWNRVPVNKAFFEPDNQPEPKVKVMVPMYQPLQITKCERCGRTIAEPKVLIGIIEGKAEYWREKS